LPLTAQMLYLTLKKQGILVRYFDDQGLDDKLRITIGTPPQNSRLVAAIAEQLS
jgi:histidinol-phosphate aminotransferase